MITFEKSLRESTFLNPADDFKPKTLEVEIRKDPLVDHIARIVKFRFRPLERVDPTPLVRKSLELGCPFCPDRVEHMATKFPPEVVAEGKIRQGGAVVFPNVFPYERYNAVVVLTSKHHIEIGKFEKEDLLDGLWGSISYLRRIVEVDADVRYGSINWNYMPPSGAGLVHPHFQLVASDLPTQFHRAMEVASKKYREREGENFWRDLISEEKGKGERYIGSTGPVHWLATFAPRGIIDVQSVFENSDNLLGVSKEAFGDFARGVSSVLRYFDTKNIWSFNLSIYGILVSQDYFWVNCRMVPRMSFPPLEISEINSFERLHGEMLTTMPPEEICGELKDFLRRAHEGIG